MAQKDSWCDSDVPVISVDLSGRSGAPYRNSVSLLDSEEETESTAL